MIPPISDDMGVKFMRIEFYVKNINGKQIITIEPSRFYGSGPVLIEYAKKCTKAIRVCMDERTEEERVSLREKLNAFIKENEEIKP